MYLVKRTLSNSVLLAFIFLFWSVTISAQEPINMARMIAYSKITTIQPDVTGHIVRMKMSDDGSKIIFTTYHTKIFTINTDGSDLTEIHDFGGRVYENIDISADGSKIVWSRHLDGSQIHVANSDGSNKNQLTLELPTATGITAPYIPEGVSPCVSADGSRIYFVNLAGGADVAGVWRVNFDGSGLTQLFSYRQMAQELFGYTGDEYNGNLAFRNAFDISDDGSHIIFGEFNFPSSGDGYTVSYDGANLDTLFNYAPAGEYGLAISGDGNKVVVSPWRFGIPSPLFSMNFDGSEKMRFLENAGTCNFGGMIMDGSRVIAQSPSLPITVIHTDGNGRTDVVSSPILADGGGNPFNYWSQTAKLTMTSDGHHFSFLCFNTNNVEMEIWVADMSTGVIPSNPTISNISLSPNHLISGAASVATFKATITSGTGSVLKAGFEGFQNGIYGQPFPVFFNSGRSWLFDDGTNGDEVAGDGVYTHTGVACYTSENPNPDEPFMVRFSTMTENHVAVVDMEPFYVLNEPTDIEDRQSPEIPIRYKLSQNYPNPFNPETTIKYTLPKSEDVILNIYNLTGQNVKILVNGFQKMGEHEITWQPAGLPSGIYFYRLQIGEFSETKKLILQK